MSSALAARFPSLQDTDLKRDAMAGVITGLMGIPLSVGICIMSDFPIQTGLITVIFACIIGFTTSLFRTGNYIGVPGIAAGLAPALALGVHTFGMQNMPFLVMVVALLQALAWKFNMQRLILKFMPAFIVEGLLAGIGLGIALKFLPYTFEADGGASFMSPEHIQVMSLSLIAMIGFVALYQFFQKKMPSVPYLAVIAFGVISNLIFHLHVVKIEAVPFGFALPLPHLDHLPNAAHTPVGLIIAEMIGYCLMLAAIDIIEQVMSNKAIEKLDPLKRSCDTNNSLLAIWIANLFSSTFGGMTNLDGLAKSTSNATAGALSKLSTLFVAGTFSIVVFFPQILSFLPKYALAVLMIFSGYKMISGLKHVFDHQGRYASVMAVMCGLLVWREGLFEGLMAALVLHYIVAFVLKLMGNPVKQHNDLAIETVES